MSRTSGSPAGPKKWSELSLEIQLEGLRAYPGTAPWLSTLNAAVNPFRRGTSDGTPRSNVHQAICHVDPFVSTAFLIKRAVEDPTLSPCIVLGETQCQSNPKCSGDPQLRVQHAFDETSCTANAECVWIPTDTDPATGLCKPKFSHFSGLSTFSAGTLWPGDSFRTNGSAEPYKSLGCPSDFCTQGDPLTEAPYNYTGSDPDFSSAPLEYIGRLDMFYQVQDMINRFGASSEAFNQDLIKNIYGGTGTRRTTRNQYRHRPRLHLPLMRPCRLPRAGTRATASTRAPTRPTASFFPSSWGSRAFLGVQRLRDARAARTLVWMRWKHHARQLSRGVDMRCRCTEGRAAHSGIERNPFHTVYRPPLRATNCSVLCRLLMGCSRATLFRTLIAPERMQWPFPHSSLPVASTSRCLPVGLGWDHRRRVPVAPRPLCQSAAVHGRPYQQRAVAQQP